jgi:peptidoglycan/xylan/chitin deacetylase (PgdA/CDA1 family)
MLRVLMYHKVSANGVKDFLTVSSDDLRIQFSYLQQNGYHSILLSDLVAYLQNKQELPTKPVLITFDDGYRDNWTVMYPLLKEYEMKATIFLVASFINKDGKNSSEDGNEYLHIEDIHAMDPGFVEFGLHSYDHKSYKELTCEEMNKDIIKAKALLRSLNIDFQPCHAFTFGAYPKRNSLGKKKFFETLQLNDIMLAFRIGNRLNPLPLRNPLLVQRLDIRGDTSFEKFASLLQKGKKIVKNWF